MPASCGLCKLSRETISNESLCPIHGDGVRTVQDYIWKVSNEEGFIPSVNYYLSDEAAASAIEMEGFEVSIIFLEED